MSQFYVREANQLRQSIDVVRALAHSDRLAPNEFVPLMDGVHEMSRRLDYYRERIAEETQPWFDTTEAA